jgi:hypothetical protein
LGDGFGGQSLSRWEPISAVIPLLLLLSIVPLAYGAGAASSWLSVPVLFAGFAGLEHALGPDRDRTAAPPSTLGWQHPDRADPAAVAPDHGPKSGLLDGIAGAG